METPNPFYPNPPETPRKPRPNPSPPPRTTTQIRCTRATIADLRQLRELIARWYARQPGHAATADFYRQCPSATVVQWAVTEAAISMIEKLRAKTPTKDEQCNSLSTASLNLHAKNQQANSTDKRKAPRREPPSAAKKKQTH